MYKIKRDEILDLLISSSYLAVIFFVPLCFAVFLQTNNVFELNKIVLFKILVLILGLFFMVKILFGEDFKEKDFFRDYSRCLIIPIFFLVFLVLNTVVSIDPETSFQGLYDRQQGLVTYFFIFFFFLLVLLNIKTLKQVRVILLAIFLSTIPVSVYALLQAYGHDFFIWSESTKMRATSTLGQPNNLGSFLILVMPISLYFFFKIKNVFIRFGILAVFILQVLALFYSYSISSWLGFIGGGVLVGLFVFWKFLKNKKQEKTKPEVGKFWKNKVARIILLFFLVAIIFIPLLKVGLPIPWVLKNKIENLVSFQSGSTAARLQFWKASWQAIKEKPFLGYGLENQGEALVRYYEKDWGVYSNVNVVPNRAHNFFLDVLLTQGMIGLIAYLALLYLFLKLILKNIAQNKERLLNYCVLMSLVSYFIYLQFNFHHTTTLIYFWLYLAIIILINRGLFAEDNFVLETINNENISLKKISYTFIAKTVLIIFIGSLCFYQISKETKLLVADHYFWEIRKSRQNNEYFSALKLFDYTKENVKDFGYYDKQFAVIMSDWLENFTNPDFRSYGEKYLDSMLPKIENERETYSNIFTKAKVYTALTSERNYSYYELAEDNFKKVIDLASELPRNYLEIAWMYDKKEDYEKAIENYNIFLEKLPELNNVYLNSDHKNVIKREMYFGYTGLSEAYKNKNEIEKYEYYLNLTESVKSL